MPPAQARPPPAHADLLRRQKAVLAPIAAAIRAEQPEREGFDATLLAWRKVTTAATLSFLDDITAPGGH